MRLLDLFCGAGGAAMGYHLAGFDEIVGVDIEPQPNYPFEFVQADALTFPIDGFDLIHASPPCQAWTAYQRRPGHVKQRPDLIGTTRLRIAHHPHVIENVPGAPLRGYVQLCGSSFGLDIRRHRWFEASWPMLMPPCQHGWQTPRFASASNRDNLRRTVEVGVWRIPLKTQRLAMGIDWMTRGELSEAIPPAYTQYIGETFLAQQKL